MPEAPLADGTFWARRTVSPIPGEQPTSLAIRRWTRQGEIIDTIALLDVTARRVVLDDTGGFATHPLWALFPGAGLGHLRPTLTADRSAIVLVGDVRPDGPEASFELLRIAISGDTLLHRPIPYDPVAIGREEERWWFREFGAVMAGDSSIGRPRFIQHSEAERNRRRERARDAFWLPESYPPVRQIIAGADDTIWILREPRVLDPEDRWEVYDSDGELIGRVTDSGGRARFTPWLPRLQVLRASREEVWATTSDELDVPYLHRFRVDRRCG